MTTSDFLSRIFSQDLSDTFIEIRCLGSEKPRRQLFSRCEDITQEVINRQQRDGYNVYYGVGRRTSAYKVHSLSTLWVDVDYKDLKDGVLPKESTVIGQMMSSLIPPSLVVNSGHGIHAYWTLHESTNDFDFAKDVLKRLALTFNGDSCYDVARILRLPGSLNLKDANNPLPCAVVGGTLQNYELSHILANVVAIPPIAPNIAQLIETGDTSGFKSRSEADFAVVLELVRQGYNMNEVIECFENEKIGDKYREKGINGKAYLQCTYDAACKRRN